jgi:hypothetical protein
MLNMSCVFTVELESKKHVKNISISDEDFDRVFFEGDLGKVSELSIIDSSALEIIGPNGALRAELGADLLRRLLESPDQSLILDSNVSIGIVQGKEGS